VISVLTEQRRFNGSLADLDAVRARVDVPLLRKDFTLDEYQIWEARAHGADLILLIVAALSDQQLREFSALSRELGMNVLVETHTPEEVERAVAAEARIIGVNVRNLKTLDVDRSVFASLAGSIPSGAVVVAESGVRNADDVAHYAAHGANAILVGEALVSDATPRERIAEFTAAGAAAIAAGPELPPNRGTICPHAVLTAGSCSSARTSTTPARTRSATCSARRCSPSGWARPA
jgi:indole-3-glycerol phosphate synthase